MDKASKILENLTPPQPQLLVGYQRLSFDPLLVSKKIDLDSSLSRPDLPKHGPLLYVPDQPLIKKSADLVPPLVIDFVPEEGDDHTTHVLLISSDSHESKRDPLILVVQESPPPIPIEHGGIM